MKVSIKVEGLQRVLDTLNKYGELFSANDFKEYIAEKSIEEINKIASERLQSSENYIANNKYEITDKGIVIYNDIKSDDGTYISLILEYGSGVHKEGKDFHHTATYDVKGGLYWLVPIDTAPSLANTDYPIITIKDTQFYMVFGQKPKHIYNDAAKIIRNKLSIWGKEYIEKEMK